MILHDVTNFVKVVVVDMLQATIFCIVTVILTKELVIATDQCTEYQFKSPFYPGVSYEDNKNPETRAHDKPGYRYYWILDGPSRVYCGMNYTIIL